MESVVGVFRSRVEAEEAVERLRNQGIFQFTVLTPGDPEWKIERISTDDMEQPGMGAAIGGVVGGAMGIAGGLELGAAVATVLIPGIGPVIVAGVLGAAMLGATGATAGAAVGQGMEQSLSEGLPKDELYLYEDALRLGRSVMVVVTESQDQAALARSILGDSGAESVNAAREHWWLGLRPIEEEAYEVQGRGFHQDEESYRKGFEAALHVDFRSKSYEQVSRRLREDYGPLADDFAFRRGYERGQQYYLALIGERPR